MWSAYLTDSSRQAWKKWNRRSSAARPKRLASIDFRSVSVGRDILRPSLSYAGERITKFRSADEFESKMSISPQPIRSNRSYVGRTGCWNNFCFSTGNVGIVLLQKQLTTVISVLWSQDQDINSREQWSSVSKGRGLVLEANVLARCFKTKIWFKVSENMHALTYCTILKLNSSVCIMLLYSDLVQGAVHLCKDGYSVNAG